MKDTGLAARVGVAGRMGLAAAGGSPLRVVGVYRRTKNEGLSCPSLLPRRCIYITAYRTGVGARNVPGRGMPDTTALGVRIATGVAAGVE